LKADQTGTAMKITPNKPDRARIDLTDDVAARAWAKKLGKSREEIAAAIEKVGDSVSAVKKELGCKADGEEESARQ
jgi:hypothetical protein